MALLQSLKGELLHRALVVVSNLLSVQAEADRQRAAVMLCEGGLLPAIGLVVERMQGEEEVNERVGALAVEIVQSISAIMNTA